MLFPNEKKGKNVVSQMFFFFLVGIAINKPTDFNFVAFFFAQTNFGVRLVDRCVLDVDERHESWLWRYGTQRDTPIVRWIKKLRVTRAAASHSRAIRRVNLLCKIEHSALIFATNLACDWSRGLEKKCGKSIRENLRTGA